VTLPLGGAAGGLVMGDNNCRSHKLGYGAPFSLDFIEDHLVELHQQVPVVNKIIIGINPAEFGF
jgi:hypothetical protein